MEPILTSLPHPRTQLTKFVFIYRFNKLLDLTREILEELEDDMKTNCLLWLQAGGSEQQQLQKVDICRFGH